MTTETRDSSTHGWLTMTRAEYDRMRGHDYAGPGTPSKPTAPGYWAMVLEDGGTVLYTGVEVTDDAAV